MNAQVRRVIGACATILLIVVGGAQAAPVELTLSGGRVSLQATAATPAQIFDAWSRAGGVLIVNADQMPAVPITITLDNVPEEQALETLLRPVAGYLARHRDSAAGDRSIFDRIVILATPANARPATADASQPSRGGVVFPSGPPAAQRVFQPPQPPAPAGVPVSPGVTRLIGPDGRPVEDDQADAPPPFNGGDGPDSTPGFRARPFPVPTPPPAQTPPSPATSAPAGVPRPGMVVPSPATPGQQPSSTPGQPAQTQPGR